MSQDDASEPLETVRFLARADSRVHIVEALLAGPATQRELRARLDGSRTTVARALRSLAERGWVADEDGTYRLTRLGRRIGSEFVGLLGAVRTTEELETFLTWFPTDLDAPDFGSATDVTVTTPGDGEPYAPARRQAEILRTADRLRILLPSVDIEATRSLAEQVTERGLAVETVVDPALEATMATEEFAPLVRRTIETGRSTVHVAASSVPLYLGLAGDGRVQVGVEDDEGFPRALVETTDDAVRAWAEATYREYREAARERPAAEF